MYSATELALMAQVADHLAGKVAMPKAAQLAAADSIRASITASLTARAALAAAAQGRVRPAPGKRATLQLSVSFGAEWTQTVLGADAAHRIVAETLAAHPGNGSAPTLASFKVILASRKQWARLLDTDAGQHLLAVARTGTSLA